MTVRLIWAEARHGVIGCNGAIPWTVTGEQQVFRNRTVGATIVMGRSTWDSLPVYRRPLVGRRNVVLTRDRSWSAPGVDVVHDPAEVCDDDFWVIGGAQVYALFLPRARHVTRTCIDLTVRGDTFAPVLGNEWKRLGVSDLVLSANGIPYRVEDLTRA